MHITAARLSFPVHMYHRPVRHLPSSGVTHARHSQFGQIRRDLVIFHMDAAVLFHLDQSKMWPWNQFWECSHLMQ